MEGQLEDNAFLAAEDGQASRERAGARSGIAKRWGTGVFWLLIGAASLCLFRYAWGTTTTITSDSNGPAMQKTVQNFAVDSDDEEDGSEDATEESSAAPSADSTMQERFVIVQNPQGRIALRTSEGTYLAAHKNGSVTAYRPHIGVFESWRIVKHSSGTVSLKSNFGKYLEVTGDGSLKANSNHHSKSKVFEELQHSDGTVSFKTSAGEFVSIAGLGVMPGKYAIYATKEDGGTRERFEVIKHGGGTVAIKSATGSYLSVDGVSVVTGSSDVSDSEKFKILHHHGSKYVAIKAPNGNLLRVYKNGTVVATATKVAAMEKFLMVEHKEGGVTFETLHGAHLTVSKMSILTFYQYRAVGPNSYPWLNVNTGNLAGVLWYLHNEVVTETPRKFGIERIVRMKFQTTSTPTLAEKGLNFGARFAYDSGMCTGAGPINGWDSCTSFYRKYSNFIGCNYLNDYPFPMASKGYWAGYKNGIWYSLPKEGFCYIGAPTGQENCTFNYEEAGEIEIKDLYGMDDYWAFANDKANREYVPEKDAGVGCDFWNKKYDQDANAERVQKASKMFDDKYPDMPPEEELKNPTCDFNCHRFYTDEELGQVGAECKCSEYPIARMYNDKVSDEECKPDTSSGLLKGMGYYADKN